MNNSKRAIDRLSALYDRNAGIIEEDYFAFLRFKSISSEPAFKADVRACALWLLKYLKDSGFAAELWEGKGHPVVFAENLAAGDDKPTILFYSHYDVQPVDPLELWQSPPFEPTVREGRVYARGAQDNKGQTMTVISALRTVLAENDSLPVNIKVCIEGQEESGSGLLLEKLKTKRDRLKADYLAVVELGMVSEDAPTISLGLRGITTMTVELTGSNSDLHSGVHGGIVYNPNHALVEILSQLRDGEGRITVPGFYDDVRELEPEIRARLWSDFDPHLYEQVFGARPNGGEKAYTFIESASIRPTLEINGISGGYAGDGFKTVIPAKACAKISCRLVPDQDPRRIWQQVTGHIRRLCPEGVRVEITGRPDHGKPFRSNPASPVVKALAQVYKEISGVETGYFLEGGSVPIVPALVEALGAETVLMGWGLMGDNMHAPNEYFSLQRLKKGFLSVARLLEVLAA